MAKTQEVLSKMQEQLDYASSRCGNLMDQLNKIKCHVKWKMSEENLNRELNLEDRNENEDGTENEDTTNYKEKLTHDQKSSESILSNVDHETDNQEISNEIETKSLMDIFYEQLSNDRGRTQILSNNSSSFESLSSGTLSITSLSGKEIKEDEAETEEDEGEIEENKAKIEKDKAEIEEVKTEEYKAEIKEDGAETEEDEEEIEEYETETEDETEECYVKIEKEETEVKEKLGEVSEEKFKLEGLIEKDDNTNVLSANVEEDLNQNIQTNTESHSVQIKEEETQPTDEEKDSLQEEEIGGETEKKYKDEEKFEEESISDSYSLSVKKSISQSSGLNSFPEILMKNIISENNGLEPPIEITDLNLDELSKEDLQETFGDETDSEYILHEEIIKLNLTGNRKQEAEGKKETPVNNRKDKFKKETEKYSRNNSTARNITKNFKVRKSTIEEENKSNGTSSKIVMIKGNEANQKPSEKPGQLKKNNQIEKSKKKFTNEKVFPNKTNKKTVNTLYKVNSSNIDKKSKEEISKETESQSALELKKKGNAVKEKDRIIVIGNNENLNKKNITYKQEINNKLNKEKAKTGYENSSQIQPNRNKQHSNDNNKIQSPINSRNREEIKLKTPINRNTDKAFKNTAVNTVNTNSIQTEKFDNKKDFTTKKLSKVKNNKIKKQQNRLKGNKSSHEIISKTLFDSIQQTLRKNLNYTSTVSQNLNENKIIQNHQKTKNEDEPVNKAETSRNKSTTIRKVVNEQNERKIANRTANNKIDTPDMSKLSKDKGLNKNNVTKGERLKVNKHFPTDKIIQNSSNELYEIKSYEIDDHESTTGNYKDNYQLKINREDTFGSKILNNPSVPNVKESNVSIKLREPQTLEYANNLNYIKSKDSLKRPETRDKSKIPKYLSNYKSETWEGPGSVFGGKTYAKSQMNNNRTTNLPTNNNRESNVTLAQSLGFNTIPFIVGQSTSRSYHIGLNIQQTLSLMKISPSVPAIKIGVESNTDFNSEKSSSFAKVSKLSYKPKTCPACVAKPPGNFKDDDDILSEDPWYVPQKDSWDQQQIANRKNTRCTCLPTNIISFNELLRQTFQADGLMASHPRDINGSYNCSTSGIEIDRFEKEKKKMNIRTNNASYLTRLLRNIQRIQEQYITPITKLSLNSFKYNTN